MLPPTFPRKFLPLIIAAVAGLAAVAMINAYMQQKAQETQQRIIQREQNMVTVVLAQNDIPAGTAIKESMLKEVRVNKNAAQPRAAASIDRLVDKIAAYPIPRGSQVQISHVSLPEQMASLSMKVPQGKRAVTVTVDNPVGGMIRAGDHVDIVGLVPVPAMGADGKQTIQQSPMPLFQDVLILAIGQDFASGATAKVDAKSSAVVTFALTTQESNLLAFVQEHGKLRLILRAPGDTSQVRPVVPASWDGLFMAVMPEAFQRRAEDEAPKKPQKQVEIYRGLKREIKVIE
jgi:Flp pilus assembly protein CpaB